ncbi:alkaline phytoceramidase [Trichoderma gamsii]|uniref:Alkaline phytoceramidase n=1 Tax=Trichoderma gamsii TaxID=398673 RepID=A0A2P4Z9V2_9HYPO|nr:alkaline phytoceramidase [Trichoderma gamsii]PON21046.1 alkaline phytoceramidase [Trichoderma gamsii]
MALSALRSAISLPYPVASPGHGFWGEQTSTLNFCEEDYALSWYCAELCNTLTNGLFMWLGIRGIRNCMKEDHPSIFLISYIGYMVVGLGSILFHATLKYPMQLVDELSMIYTTCLMMHASFSYSRSQVFSVILGAGLLSLAGSITLYYYLTKDPIFHQVAYAALTATVVFRSIWVMESQVRPVLHAQDPKRASKLLNTMWAMVATGLAVFVGGFLIWNLDNFFCSQVRRWRHAVGLPWAILLEGHAWWHLMTGLVAYYYITWGTWLRHCLAGRGDKYALVWPRLLTSVPYLKMIEEDQDQDQAKKSQ